MFTLRAEVTDWPFFGPSKGMTVRFFEKVGPFVVRQTGSEWRVMDSRIRNHRGGGDVGVTFASQAEAEAFIRSH